MFQNGVADFEELAWYESLMFYSFRDQEISTADSDLKLVPSLVEKVLVPRLTGNSTVILPSCIKYWSQFNLPSSLGTNIPVLEKDG